MTLFSNANKLNFTIEYNTMYYTDTLNTDMWQLNTNTVWFYGFVYNLLKEFCQIGFLKRDYSLIIDHA